MAFIGLDLGSSYIKGAVLDLERRALTHIHRIPFPSPISACPPFVREFDPLSVIAVVQDVLGVLSQYNESWEGLVMCGQMHGLVLTTDKGEPCSQLTTWQDQRDLMPHPSSQGTYFDMMKQHITPEQVRQLGNELRPGLPIGMLFWLVEQGRLPDPDLFVASLPDFVVANLCRATPCTETTHAMAHGALNLETLDWHHEVIASLGLGGLQWPELRPHGTVVGWLELDGQAVPCFTPVGDYQCAMIGALLDYGELSVNISTGSQVSLLKPRLEFGDFQTRPFFDGRFLATITHIPAGRALNALVKLLTELAEAQGFELASPWEYIAQTAARVRPTRMRAHVAFFPSSCGDHGEFTNVREEELTVGHLFRAVFQSMADNYYACALRVSPEKAWRNLVFSGGLAQKLPLLRELIQERFGVACRLCPASEDTLLGLLALALAFTGRTASVEQAMAELLQAYREDDAFRS